MVNPKPVGTTLGKRTNKFNDGVITLAEIRFAEEYVKDFNATQACIRTGQYPNNKNNVASAAGNRYLNKPWVRDYIQELLNKMSEKCMTDVNDLMEFWTGVMLDPNEAISNRLKASDYLAKVLGAYNVKVETNQAPTIIMDLGLPPAPEQLAIAPAVEIIMEDDDDLEEECHECNTE